MALEKIRFVFGLGHPGFFQKSSGVDLVTVTRSPRLRFHIVQAPIIRFELHTLIIQSLFYLWINSRRAACFGLRRLGALWGGLGLGRAFGVIPRGMRAGVFKFAYKVSGVKGGIKLCHCSKVGHSCPIRKPSNDTTRPQMSIADPLKPIPREPGAPPVVGVLPRQTEVRPGMNQGLPPGVYFDKKSGDYVTSEPKELPPYDLMHEIDQFRKIWAKTEGIDVAIAVAEFLKKVPAEILKETALTISDLSDLVTEGLEKLGTNQDYAPPSLPKVRNRYFNADTARAEMMGVKFPPPKDASKLKFPGVVSVLRTHEQILIQGIQVLRHRMAKVQIELIEGLESSIKQFLGKQAALLTAKVVTKAAALAMIKEIIDKAAVAFSVASSVETQTKIEQGIRAESAASMLKFARRGGYPQNRKFKDGVTRIPKLVMSRHPKKKDGKP